MKPLTVLGIETSCDETAAAVVRVGESNSALIVMPLLRTIPTAPTLADVPGDVAEFGRELRRHRRVRRSRFKYIPLKYNWFNPTDRRDVGDLMRDVRGVLGKVANAIAGEDCNIQNVSTDGEQGTYSTLYITVQVTHRLHLARVIRGIRNIPEVVRIARGRGDQKGS